MIRDAIDSLTSPIRAAIAAAALAAVVILTLFVLTWGQSRYDAGVEAENARWEEAGRRLTRQADAAANHANRREATRQQTHAARRAEDMEKIAEALAAGSSPLDALFGVRDDPRRRSPEAAR